MLHRRSVVVTGVGAVTPLGTSFDAIGDALLAGRSGVIEVDGGGFCREDRQFAAPAILPDPGGSTLPFDRLGRMCLLPCLAAIADARLRTSTAANPRRVGLVLGVGAEQLKTWEADFLEIGRAHV